MTYRAALIVSLSFQEFISDRLFDIADEDGRGELNQQQAFDTVSILVIGDTEQKLRLMFAIYDVNGKIPQSF